MHWKNSNWQLLTIVNSCHTADEAYRVLRVLEEDRKFALAISEAETHRAASKLSAGDDTISNGHDWERETAKADSLEYEARKDMTQRSIDAANAELAFIRKLIDFVQPHRKYKQYDDVTAHQMCQRDETAADLIYNVWLAVQTGSHVSPELLSNCLCDPNPAVFAATQELLKNGSAIHSKSDLLKMIPEIQALPAPPLELMESNDALPGTEKAIS